ncbi:MAG TPA: glycosyltransferase [Negativicutes bacterium]|nr:glycosyltransferase [Negativicutes bacterium]
MEAGKRREATVIDKAKALIITASIGAGHTRAANAVRDALLDKKCVSQASVVDFLDSRDAAGRLIKDTYLKMLDVFPHAYDLLYRWSQESTPGSNLGSLTALVLKRKLLRLLAEHRPDVLVFTHPFPACAAASLRRNGLAHLPMAAVLTDFAVHRLWVHREIDLYFVASQEMKKALGAFNIPEERIYATGIPVAAEFAGPPAGCRAGRGPSILIMGGGLGLGAIEQAILDLAAVGRRLSVTVVAGGNETLRQRIKAVAAYSPHNIEVLGFTDSIHELMTVATLLITKPGALTCSEALATVTPLLLFGSLPGQEEENAAYLAREGAAVRADGAGQLGRVVAEMLSRPDMMNGMRARAEAIGRPQAAAAVAAIIGEYTSQRQRVTPAS